MKKLKLYAICICAFSGLFSQKVEIATSTEEMDTTQFFRLTKSYEKLIMAKREELALLKVDLLGPLLYAMSGIDTAKHNLIRVSFEQKIKPEWSWVIAAEGQASKEEFTELRYKGGVRYYFNMQKRILKGKSANNFSASYLSARVTYKQRPPDNDNQISIDLLFGIQRRLWKYGYVDFDIGIENLISPFETKTAGIDFTSSVQIGIAF